MQQRPIATSLPEWLIRDIEAAVRRQDSGTIKVAYREGGVIGFVDSTRKSPPPPASTVPQPCPKCGTPLVEEDQARKVYCSSCDERWSHYAYVKLRKAAFGTPTLEPVRRH